MPVSEWAKTLVEINNTANEIIGTKIFLHITITTSIREKGPAKAGQSVKLGGFTGRTV